MKPGCCRRHRAFACDATHRALNLLSILPARSSEAFEAASKFCRKLARWDAEAVRPYGVSADDVMDVFHSKTSGGDLAEQFSSADAKLLVAPSAGLATGRLAFNPFDEGAVELHKFFVDTPFRGMGIGRAPMREAMTEIGKGRRRVRGTQLSTLPTLPRDSRARQAHRCLPVALAFTFANR